MLYKTKVCDRVQLLLKLLTDIGLSIEFAVSGGEAQLYGVSIGGDSRVDRLLSNYGLGAHYSSAPTMTGVTSLLFAALFAIVLL